MRCATDVLLSEGHLGISRGDPGRIICLYRTAPRRFWDVLDEFGAVVRTGILIAGWGEMDDGGLLGVVIYW